MNLGTTFIDVPSKIGIVEVGVKNSLISVDYDMHIYTREIIVVPKLVVVNKTGTTIKLR
jgi:hypothetical protein